MNKDEVITRISDKAFIDAVYRYSYRRCGSAHEAEDLCGDILLALLTALRSKTEIEHFYAFVWTVAHRVYADFCENRRRTAERVCISIENPTGGAFPDDGEASPFDIPSPEDEIEQFLEKEEEAVLLAGIRRELAYLSAAYRQTMILYYLDGAELPQIAERLGVSVNTVKQRLFYGRNRIRKKLKTGSGQKPKKEKKKMRDLTLKPIVLDFAGTGNPVGNEPEENVTRRISRNLIYLCKSSPKTAGELSEALGVPMPYVEEELEIQCKGANGSYGTLRRTEDGRYLSNVLLLDRQEYEEGVGILRAYAPVMLEGLREAVRKKR